VEEEERGEGWGVDCVRLGEWGGGRVRENDSAAVMRSGCARDDTKTRRRANGWVGSCTCNEIGTSDPGFRVNI